MVEQLKAFIRQASENEELAARVKQVAEIDDVQGRYEALAQIAQDAGFEVTAGDFEAASSPDSGDQTGELDESELAAVVGGMANNECSCLFGGGGDFSHEGLYEHCACPVCGEGTGWFCSNDGSSRSKDGEFHCFCILGGGGDMK